MEEKSPSNGLSAVFARYEHLDRVLRDGAMADDPIYRICAALWTAIADAQSPRCADCGGPISEEARGNIVAKAVWSWLQQQRSVRYVPWVLDPRSADGEARRNAVASDGLLAPCPFCGSTNITKEYHPESEFPTSLLSLICECGCEFHGTQDERGTMIAEWNRRGNERYDHAKAAEQKARDEILADLERCILAAASSILPPA